MWKIEKVTSKGAYNYAVVPNHPYAIKSGYVLEHRVVMENTLGRLLTKDEVVHHINGDTKDNRACNLKVYIDAEHRREHSRLHGRVLVVLKCPECGKVFEKRKGATFLQQGGIFTACSRRCRGCFSRKLQTYTDTRELDIAIANNVVKEYTYYPSLNTDDLQENAHPVSSAE